MASAPVAAQGEPPAPKRGCCGAADPNDKYGMLPDGSRKCRDMFGCLLFLVFCALRRARASRRGALWRGGGGECGALALTCARF